MEAVREMFTHGYDSYMASAFPYGELLPLSCSGQSMELSKIPGLTLIDTLDTLVVLGNHSEFRRGVERLLEEALPSGFDLDVNVSVFETNIRVLGGLISAHLMATDPELGIYDIYPPPRRKAGYRRRPFERYAQAKPKKDFPRSIPRRREPVASPEVTTYDGCLLDLAEDLGERLLPAFRTATTIPYGTVNLRYGVPPDETVISSLAGAGSLSLE
eukprot:CAMPEP_0185761930 /NCGR_PEP_ID=MMETSP1174-20130828/20882_1 /TAXON_ID=35687 /ORGANISM="Dictyocha speculum, Strain CCMP1381" /LENGTH=214 /DNA_ID=CAMNT_0028443377 /DNA_START=15 /DNA_END=656 /DNA_ORIENTATION=+